MNKNEVKMSRKLILFRLAALIATGLLVQIGAAYLVNGILYGVPSLSDLNNEYQSSMSDFVTMESRRIVYICFFAPLVEELVFRFGLMGFGMDLIKRITEKNLKVTDEERRDLIIFWGMNVLQAILFGFYHGNIVQGSYAFVLGTILGYVYMYLGKIPASLLVHVIINVAGIYLMPFLPSDMPVGGIIVIGAVVLAIAVILLVYARKMLAVTDTD